VLVAVPEARGGAARVAKRVDVQVAELVGVGDEFGEGGGGVRVINVPLLPKACHDEMIFDDEGDELAVFRADVKPLEDGQGDLDAALGVSLDAAGLADVVE